MRKRTFHARFFVYLSRYVVALLCHPPKRVVPIANHLLAALPRSAYQHLRASLEPVKLTFREVLFEPGKPIRPTCFPNDCLVSMMAVVEGRTVLEVGLVGSEGTVGIPVALGIGVSTVRALDLLRYTQELMAKPCKPPCAAGFTCWKHASPARCS